MCLMDFQSLKFNDFIQYTVLNFFFDVTLQTMDLRFAYDPPPARVKTKPKTRTKNKFTPEEDELLKEQVKEHGEKGWRKIAEHLPGRTARQCRERWVNYLTPKVSLAPWTAEEDLLLNSLVAEHGKQWSKISSFFPSRTDVQLKNRYNSVKRTTIFSQNIKKLKKSKATQVQQINSTIQQPQQINQIQEQPQPQQQQQFALVNQEAQAQFEFPIQEEEFNEFSYEVDSFSTFVDDTVYGWDI